jgi:hypothetical protein
VNFTERSPNCTSSSLDFLDMDCLAMFAVCPFDVLVSNGGTACALCTWVRRD